MNDSPALPLDNIQWIYMYLQHFWEVLVTNEMQSPIYIRFLPNKIQWYLKENYLITSSQKIQVVVRGNKRQAT